MDSGNSQGRVVLAGTPIGDVDDASPRLRQLLADATVIAAEDTRRVRALLQRLGVEASGRIVSYHEHNEQERVGVLLDVVREGGTVLVVSDAGMPTVSDPGYRIVAAAIDAGMPVTAAPGPSAVLTALAVSGLPTDRFTFEGFPGRKSSARARDFAELATQPRTMVFFESPRRLAATLADAAAAFGPERKAAVCRELTKTYEEVIRGPLGELAQWAADTEVRGEITVVVAGAAKTAATIETVLPMLLARVDTGERLKDVAAELSAVTNVPARELYQAALAARKP